MTVDHLRWWHLARFWFFIYSLSLHLHLTWVVHAYLPFFGGEIGLESKFWWFDFCRVNSVHLLLDFAALICLRLAIMTRLYLSIRTLARGGYLLDVGMLILILSLCIIVLLLCFWVIRSSNIVHVVLSSFVRSGCACFRAHNIMHVVFLLALSWCTHIDW